VTCVLIDDQGDIWDGEALHVRRAFDSPHSDGEFTSYVVRNLGFVAADRYGTSCQVRLRPGLVSRKTVDTLRHWLTTQRFARIAICCFEKTWSFELVATASDALDRLDQILQRSRVTTPDQFLVRPMQSSRLGPESKLLALARDWGQLTRSGKRDLIWQRVREAVGDRFAVAKRDPSTNRIVFDELGPGLYPRNPTWRARALGQPVEEQPDTIYGQWIETAYRTAIEVKRPRFDDVDAIVRWPETGRFRLRYHRIILPLALSASENYILGGSIVNDGIDLRIRPVEKLQKILEESFAAGPQESKSS
jgi:hypothetical protein